MSLRAFTTIAPVMIALALLHACGVDTRLEERQMNAAVNGDNERVWIEGIPQRKLGHLGDDWTLQLQAVQVLMLHRGEQVELDELLAHSGEAFNLCHSDRWELRTYLSLPTDSLGTLARAYGYNGRWLTGGWFHQMRGKGKHASTEGTRHILKQLWSEIDAGRPVLVAGVDGHCGNWFVAAGYDRKEDQMCYVGGKNAYQWSGISGINVDTCGDPEVGKLGFWDSRVRGAIRPGFLGGWLSNVAFILGEKTADIEPKQRVVESLRLATRMFRPGLQVTKYSGVTYYFGEKAYERWADDLHRLDYPGDITKPRPEAPEIYDLSTMTYQVEQIVRGRSAAAKLCEQAASLLPHSKQELLEAAGAYREEVAIAKETFAPFLGGTEKQWDNWLSSEAQREAGAAAIRELLVKEHQAIAQIEKVLSGGI